MRKDHTPECLALQAVIAAEQAAFFARWPNFCKHCWGSGGHWDPGSWWQPPDWDSCSQCADLAICPLCGREHNEDWGSETCTCGWDTDYQTREQHGIVYPHIFEECRCFDLAQAEIDAQQELTLDLEDRRWKAMTPQQKDAFYAASDMAYDISRERHLFRH